VKAVRGFKSHPFRQISCRGGNCRQFACRTGQTAVEKTNLQNQPSRRINNLTVFIQVTPVRIPLPPPFSIRYRQWRFVAALPAWRFANIGFCRLTSASMTVASEWRFGAPNRCSRCLLLRFRQNVAVDVERDFHSEHKEERLSLLQAGRIDGRPVGFRFWLVRKNRGWIRARAVFQVSDKGRVPGNGRCGSRGIFS